MSGRGVSRTSPRGAHDSPTPPLSPVVPLTCGAGSLTPGDSGDAGVWRPRSPAVPADSAYMPWTDEQVRILAQAEASLPLGTRLINAALAAVYPTRSLDAIKGLRWQARYRVMLAEESAKLATPSTAPSDEQAVPSGAESEGSEEATGYFSGSAGSRAVIFIWFA
ncbi:hypothetical protein MTO96_036114 [Rhipicephalus appendiculatus]